jgi:hypothetical protein
MRLRPGKTVWLMDAPRAAAGNGPEDHRRSTDGGARKWRTGAAALKAMQAVVWKRHQA